MGGTPSSLTSSLTSLRNHGKSHRKSHRKWRMTGGTPILGNPRICTLCYSIHVPTLSALVGIAIISWIQPQKYGACPRHSCVKNGSSFQPSNFMVNHRLFHSNGELDGFLVNSGKKHGATGSERKPSSASGRKS